MTSTLRELLETKDSNILQWWDTANYSEVHREELKALIQGEEWKRILDSPEFIEDVKENTIEIARFRNPERTIIEGLLAVNEEHTQQLIQQGIRDRKVLFDALATYPENFAHRDPKFSFLGLSLTSDCNFLPACEYCNKEYVPSATSITRWKEVIEDAIGELNGGEGPYIYFTGGEPLLLREELYGDDGLIRFATERGAAVNVNTNAVLITPEVAMRLIKAGTPKLHISLDTPHAATQNRLVSGAWFEKIVTGMYNIQIAREIIGVNYPIVHINCVLTNVNMPHYIDLLRFLWERRKTRTEGFDGPIQRDRMFRDLLLHVIPVGGGENKDIRLTAEEFRTFLTDKWQEACTAWDEHQKQFGIPENERLGLGFYGFHTPYFRGVRIKGSLDDYVKLAAEGIYSKLGLADRCYVAPTQSFLLPDGSQHWCGAHTISRPYAIGNINETNLFDNIRGNIFRLADLPDEYYCRNCPAATLAINQNVENMLNKKIDEWLGEGEDGKN